jgi:hypothetical protein
MSLPPLKMGVTPVLRARVLAGSGIGVTQNGLDYTVSVNLGSLAIEPNPNRATVGAVVDDGGTLKRVLLDNFVTDGSISTAKLADKAVTFAKVEDIASGRLIGRVTAGDGSVEEIPLGPSLSLASGSLETVAGAGTIIDRAYAEYTTNTFLNPTIPADDTVPQSSEGTQILSVSITPKSPTNRLRVRFQGVCGADGDVFASAALFVNSETDARRSTIKRLVTNILNDLQLEFEFVPGSASAQTLSVRVGPSGGSMRMNGLTTGRLHGGALACTLIVEEIKI